MRTVIPDLRGFFSAPPFSFTWVGDTNRIVMRRNFGDNLISEIIRYYPSYSTPCAPIKTYVEMRNQIMAKEGEGWEIFFFGFPRLDFELRDHIDHIGEYSIFENKFMPLICKNDFSEFILDTDYTSRHISEFADAIENIQLLDYFSNIHGNKIDKILKMFDYYISNRETLPPRPDYYNSNRETLPPIPNYILSNKIGNYIIRDALEGKYRFNYLVNIDTDELEGIITQLKFKYIKDFKPSFKDYAHLI